VIIQGEIGSKGEVGPKVSPQSCVLLWGKTVSYFSSWKDFIRLTWITFHRWHPVMEYCRFGAKLLMKFPQNCF